MGDPRIAVKADQIDMRALANALGVEDAENWEMLEQREGSCSIQDGLISFSHVDDCYIRTFQLSEDGTIYSTTEENDIAKTFKPDRHKRFCSTASEALGLRKEKLKIPSEKVKIIMATLGEEIDENFCKEHKAEIDEMKGVLIKS